MGLFSKKTKQNSTSISPPLPRMPDFDSQDLPEFPEINEEDDSLHYEPTIADIKNEVGKDEEDEEFEIPEAEIKPSRIRNQLEKREIPDKPIFVKIDTYKEVLHNIDMLKIKINDAEDILKNLENVRSEEEEKLIQWKKDLQDIKEKLLSIDSELFEV